MIERQQHRTTLIGDVDMKPYAITISHAMHPDIREVRIHEGDMITIDGVRVTGEALKAFFNPNPDQWINMERVGDVIHVAVLHNDIIKHIKT